MSQAESYEPSGAAIDFDAYIRDPNSPESIMAGLSDDWLHPNARGLRVMAESVDLSLFGGED